MVKLASGGSKEGANIGELEIEEGHGSPDHKKLPSSTSKGDHVGGRNGEGNISGGSHQMPPASVMTRLILIMVWRKLIRNPNTYSSLIGVVWSLICYRCPDIICLLCNAIFILLDLYDLDFGVQMEHPDAHNCERFNINIIRCRAGDGHV